MFLKTYTNKVTLVHIAEASLGRLGENSRSGLASQMGAKCNKMGNLIVDYHQRTTVSGLYASGDVVNELSQISVAAGQVAVAATDIHNWLNRKNDKNRRMTHPKR